MWSFKETRETRKELISKGGGEGSCLRKRAKLERNLYPREGGGGRSCFTKRAKLERNLYPREGGRVLLIGSTSISRYVESRGEVVNFFSDSFLWG